VTEARARFGPASGGDAGLRTRLGLGLSVLLHAVVLGGLLWWVARDIPPEIPEQGVELMWDQPNQASLAAGPEGDTARPEAPPSVAPPPAPEAEAEPQPPEATPPPPPPPAPRLAEPTPPPPSAAQPPPPSPAPPLAATQVPPPPQPAPMPPPPPLAQRPDGVLPPPPPPQPATPQSAAAPPPQPAEPPRQEAARPEPPQPAPTPPQPRPEPQRAEPTQPPPRPEPPRPTRQAAPRPTPRQSPAAQPGPPQPSEAPPAQPGGSALALGATSAPSLDPGCANPPPIYPSNSRLRGEEGVVRIVVTTGPNGRALGTQILASSGFPALDDAARRAVLGWCFRPALRNGEPVQGQVATNIRFTLQ
jgi:protein TonB